MQKLDENILRTAKEIIVKFIETGRVSPTGFPETFKTIYRTIEETVLGAASEAEADEKQQRKRRK